MRSILLPGLLTVSILLCGGCASMIEDSLQSMNRERYESGEISFVEYMENDLQLEHFDEEYQW